MEASDLTVEVRNKSLARLGIIRPEEMDLVLRDDFNSVGSWTLTLPSTHRMVDDLKAPGSGLIFTTDEWVVSGPTVGWEHVSDVGNPDGNVVFSGATDDIILADRLAYSDPTTDDVTLQSESSVTDKPASLMAYYVMANAGTDAVSSRQIPSLEMAADYPSASVWSHGSNVTKTARFQTLGSLLSEIAARDKHVGFRIVQRDDVLCFECFLVADRTATIRLDLRNNTLVGQKLIVAPPTVTRVIAAGSSDSNRVLREVSTTDSTDAEDNWGRRIERIVDARSSTRPSDVASDLEDAGQEVLADDGVTAISTQASPSPNSSMAFGRTWNIGDKVSVVAGDTEYPQTVSGMIVRSTPGGFGVGAIIGDPRAFEHDAGLAKQQKARIDKLEKVGTTTPIPAGGVGTGGGGSATWSSLGGSGTIGSPEFDDVTVTGPTYSTSVVDNAIGTLLTGTSTVAPLLLNPLGGLENTQMGAQEAEHDNAMTTTASWVYSSYTPDDTKNLAVVWPPSGKCKVTISANVGSVSSTWGALLSVRVKDSGGTEILPPNGITGPRHARRVESVANATGSTMTRTFTVKNADFATPPSEGDIVLFELAYGVFLYSNSVFFTHRALLVEPSL